MENIEVKIQPLENGYLLTAQDGKHYFYTSYQKLLGKLGECFGIKEAPR